MLLFAVLIYLIFSKTKSTTILQCFLQRLINHFFNDVEKLLHTANVWNFYFLMATWFLLTCEFRRTKLPPPQHFIHKWWWGGLCHYVCRHFVLPLYFHFRSDLSSFASAKLIFNPQKWKKSNQRIVEYRCYTILGFKENCLKVMNSQKDFVAILRYLLKVIFESFIIKTSTRLFQEFCFVFLILPRKILH